MADEVILRVQERTTFEGKATILHPETEAGVVLLSDGRTVQESIDKIEHGDGNKITKDLLDTELQDAISRAETLSPSGVAKDSEMLGGRLPSEYASSLAEAKINRIPMPNPLNAGEVLSVNANGDYVLTKPDSGGETPTSVAIKIGQCIYNGEDITVKCKTEIDTVYGGDPWKFIQMRCRTSNFDNLYPGDFIPWTSLSGNFYQSEIMGVCTYFGVNPVNPTPKHIDFITRQVYRQDKIMNRVANNNGTSDNTNPYMASDLYHWINCLKGSVLNSSTNTSSTIPVDYTTTGGLINLPQNLRNVLIKKQAFLNDRYSQGILLGADNGYSIREYGPIWFPAEVEVMGHRAFSSTNGYSGAGYIQYPLFTQSGKKIKKTIENATVDYWLIDSVGSTNNTTHFTTIGRSGEGATIGANSSYFIAICFRIG